MKPTTFLNIVLRECASNMDNNILKSKVKIGFYTKKFNLGIFGNRENKVHTKAQYRIMHIDEYVSICKKHGVSCQIIEKAVSEKRDIYQDVEIYIEYEINNPRDFILNTCEPYLKMGQAFKRCAEKTSVVQSLSKKLLEEINSIANSYNFSATGVISIGITNEAITLGHDNDGYPLSTTFSRLGYENLKNESMRVGLFLAIFESIKTHLDSNKNIFSYCWLPNAEHNANTNGFNIYINKNNANKPEFKSWL